MQNAPASHVQKSVPAQPSALKVPPQHGPKREHASGARKEQAARNMGDRGGFQPSSRRLIANLRCSNCILKSKLEETPNKKPSVE